MRFAVGTDHAGFPLKAAVIDELRRLGHDVIDKGTHSMDAVDYPDFARAVGESVAAGEAERGIILCGSGVGASIAACKIRGVRAAICHDTYSAHQGVEHDDMNVLTIGARVIGPELAMEIVRAFAGAAFSGEERHARRLKKVLAIEDAYTREKEGV
ncbi:MAG TPA: ribose 5-phosphate isomerase B [Dehalococcoidia bacterium]|nr:ribose 5-phosphate isomerase B [Dehalococcoidia bacterium]